MLSRNQLKVGRGSRRDDDRGEIGAEVLTLGEKEGFCFREQR